MSPGFKLYGLIGFPLGHSFSVPYFTEKFTRENIDAAYRNFPIRAVSGLASLPAQEPELAGLNVTVPHKQAVIPLMDKLDPTAAEIGAVNTITIDRSEGQVRLLGANTDVTGFRQSLEERLPEGIDRALVLGSGGSSRAVTHVLELLGIGYQMVSRRKGEGLLTYEELDAQVVRDHTLIINTTPLGMHPKVDACPDIPYEGIGHGHLLFDLVYNPAKTLFLLKGEQKGAAIVNGYDMLVYQAEASWKIWTGQRE